MLDISEKLRPFMIRTKNSLKIICSVENICLKFSLLHFPGESHAHRISRRGCFSLRFIFIGNDDVLHREWGCASSGMHILTGNAHSLYKVIFTLQTALIQISEISFASEVCGIRWRHFYDKIVNKIPLQIWSSYLAN